MTNHDKPTNANLILKIEALTKENAELKLRLARAERQLPTDDRTRKKQFIEHHLERLGVIHSQKNVGSKQSQGA